MARTRNPKIGDFRKKVEWIVANLDPDPSYARYLSEPKDVFDAFEGAVSRGVFSAKELGSPLKAKTSRHLRTWQTALSKGSVPTMFSDWLFVLYPDLTPAQLFASSISEFEKLGDDIQRWRDYWTPAVQYFAKNRNHLKEVSKRFYSAIDQSDELALDGLEFPLITQRNWIRGEPLELTATSERAALVPVDGGMTFKIPKLDGLLGSYASYKGSLGYPSRRVVRTEPQHNGEIFCVKDVRTDDLGFTGFRYFLANYFDYINTSEILGAELARWVLSNSSGGIPPRLPLRGSPVDALDMTNRASYPGVNCLSIFLNYSEARLGKGNYFLLHKRDETQLQAQNSVHVVPAGGHQGFAKGAFIEDTAIWRTVVREFCEELFDCENLNMQPETWADFLLYKNVDEIQRVFFTDGKPAARVFLHGFGLDPVTIKPEVLVTIVIDWDKVRTRATKMELKFNWELQQKVKKAGTRHQWARLSKAELVRQARGGVQSLGEIRLPTLPAGAACMMQTARHYEWLQLP